MPYTESGFTEPDNDDRAAFARAALHAYIGETRHDGPDLSDGSMAMDEGFRDLLCDLQHLAMTAGLDFQWMLGRGTACFEGEVAEEQNQDRVDDEMSAGRIAEEEVK